MSVRLSPRCVTPSCLPVRGPWVIAVLEEVVGGKGQVGRRRGGDAYQRPHRLSLTDVAHLQGSSVRVGPVGYRERGRPE